MCFKFKFIYIDVIPQVDVNQLLQESINFQEVSLLKIENAFSHKVDLIPYKSQKDTKITIVVPSERTKNLSLSKLNYKYVVTTFIIVFNTFNAIIILIRECWWPW